MHLSRRGLLTGVTAATLPLSTSARTREGARLSPQAQREDLGIVRTVFEESHVGLNWTLDRASYERLFAGLLHRALQPSSSQQFRLGLTRFIAALGHGHTFVEPTAMGRGYRLRQLPVGTPTLPLGVRIVGDRIYVAHDLTAEMNVGAGTELLQVNGTGARSLLTALEALVSSDGNGRSFKQHQIGPGWRLQDLLPVLQGERDRHRLKLRKFDGRVVDLAVASATSEQLMSRFAERRGRSLDAFGPAVAYSTVGRNGVLAVGSFYEGLLAPGSPGFAAEFANAFKRIAETRPDRLLLDLRSNEGGNNDLVPMLYAYLTDQPFRFPGVTIVKSDRMSGIRYVEQPPEDLKAFSIDPRKFIDSDPTFGWRLKGEFGAAPVHAPSPNAYLGPLTVLTDGGSFSATGGLIDLIHRFHRREGREVTFLGEAPGVDTRLGWGSGGQSLAITLPNSRLRVAVPLLGSPYHFASLPTPVRLPDRLLQPTAEDLRTGRDGVLARASELMG